MSKVFFRTNYIKILWYCILLFQLFIYIHQPLVHDLNDSASYYMNVHYVTTGHYITEDLYPSFKAPNQLYPFFGYTVILYACKLLSMLFNLPWAIWVKIVQFICYALTAFVFVRIAYLLTNSNLLSHLTGLLYVFYYPHFYHANLVMSETYAIFIIALCILLFIRFTENHSVNTAVILLITSGHLALIKPVCSLLILFFIVYVIVVYKQKKTKALSVILCLFIVPVLQIFFSLSYYNNMQIRKGFGRNLWNRVIACDKLIPQNSSTLLQIDSVFKNHNEAIPYDNWWNITVKLSQYGYTEQQTMDICNSIAWEGIRENPFQYFKNTFTNSYDNYNYGVVCGRMHCSVKEFETAINLFNYDRNHTPLVDELLKQSFKENKTRDFILNMNCKLEELSSKFYFLYHNFVLIFLYILSGIYFAYRLIKKSDKKFIQYFCIWWCGFSIIFGSNLTEFPQSRLILPGVMYVILSVILFAQNFKKRATN